MIHMADLISKRGDYEAFSINDRVNIFNCIYHFARKVPVKYYSIFVDKNYTTKRRNLKRELTYNINKMIKNNKKYFSFICLIILIFQQLHNISLIFLFSTILSTSKTSIESSKLTISWRVLSSIFFLSIKGCLPLRIFTK